MFVYSADEMMSRKNQIKDIFQKNKRGIIGLILLLLGFLYYLPRFLMEGIPHYLNEDTYMHLNRMVGLRNVWRSPVSFLNFAHNGPAVNIFYPWLPMYPMYIFYRLTGSYVTAYKVYYLLLTVVTLFLAYSVMKEISKNRFGALLFAILYTYSAYRFTNVFRRAHLGESISMTALLLVVMGLYQTAFGDRKHWRPLAAGMAVIAYSHNIFLLITSLVIGLYVLISVWFWECRRERMLSLCKAAASALLLSLGSFIPILQYLLTNHLYTPGGSGDGLAETAFGLKTIIEKSLLNQPVSFAAGLLVLAALVWLIVFYGMHAAGKSGRRRNPGIDCFALSGALIFLSATSLLPWKWIGDHTPLYFIQFVWRLNSQSTVYILAAFCYYFPKTLQKKSAKIPAAAGIMLLCVGLHYSAVLTLHKEENTRIFEADIASGNAVTFDYAPQEAKEYRSIHGYTMDDVYLNGLPYPAEMHWSDDGTVLTVTIDAPESTDGNPLAADLPVFRYSTQICLLDGEETAAALSERGTALVNLNPGAQNVISVFCRHTKLTYASWIISLTAFVLIFRFGKKKKTDIKH